MFIFVSFLALTTTLSQWTNKNKHTHKQTKQRRQAGRSEPLMMTTRWWRNKLPKKETNKQYKTMSGMLPRWCCLCYISIDLFLIFRTGPIFLIFFMKVWTGITNIHTYIYTQPTPHPLHLCYILNHASGSLVHAYRCHHPPIYLSMRLYPSIQHLLALSLPSCLHTTSWFSYHHPAPASRSSRPVGYIHSWYAPTYVCIWYR